MLDIIIKDGLIVDGTRSAAYKGDIGIKDGIIKEIQPELCCAAKEVIDADGLVVAPGFIDIHSHSDLCSFVPGLKPQSKLYQGITLEIIGNCGMSCIPVNDATRLMLTDYISKSLELPLHGIILEDDSIIDYAEHVKKLPAASNIGVLIGHGTLRGCVMGMEMRPPSKEEQKQMEDVLAYQLSNGAFGMSLGLVYSPSSYGAVDELTALAKVIAKYDALLTVHLRSEGAKIFEAVDEMLEIAKKSGARLEISHLKLMGKKQWGRAKELLQKIKCARSEGIKVTCDQYPYLATSTGLSVIVPKWATDGGFEAMCGRLKNPSDKLKAEIADELESRGGPESVLITSGHGKGLEFEGKRLSQIMDKYGIGAVDSAIKVLMETDGAASCCYFSLSENDVEDILKEVFIAVGTDGYALSFGNGFIKNSMHPRSFGTFPKYFELIREKKLLSLEDAVYKVSGLPAQILGIKNRGLLLPGMAADITVFDYANIRDNADYINSAVKPQGIKYVVVGGKIALSNGEQAGENTGKVIFHGQQLNS